MYGPKVKNRQQRPRFVPSRPSPLSLLDSVGLRNSQSTTSHHNPHRRASTTSLPPPPPLSSSSSSPSTTTTSTTYNLIPTPEEADDAKQLYSKVSSPTDHDRITNPSINPNHPTDSNSNPNHPTDSTSVPNHTTESSHIKPRSSISPPTAKAPFLLDSDSDSNSDHEYDTDYHEMRQEFNLRKGRAGSDLETPSVASSVNVLDRFLRLVPPELLNRLRLFPLFKDAPKLFHGRIALKLKLIQYHAQATIIRKGDDLKSMYWILKGTVAVTLEDAELIYAELIPGYFFGEIGILFNRPRTATVVARTRVLLGVLTLDALDMILPEYPHIERHIRDEAQERLAMLDKQTKAAKLLKYKSDSDAPKSRPISRRSSVIKMFIDPQPQQQQQQSQMAQLAQPSDHVSSSDSMTITNNTTSSANVIHPPNTYTKKVPLINPGQLLQPVSTLFNPTIPSPSIPPIHIERAVLPSVDDTLPDSVDLTVSIREFIRNIPIFQNLPLKFIHKLALGVEPVLYQPFEYVFHVGDSGADIYFIIGGEVEVFNYYEVAGKKYEDVLARLGYGSYFGEMSFLLQLDHDGTTNTRSANVRTVSSCDMIVIRHDKLEELCRTYSFILEDMKKTASARNALNKLTREPSGSRIAIENLVVNDLDLAKTKPSFIDPTTRADLLVSRSNSPLPPPLFSNYAGPVFQRKRPATSNEDEGPLGSPVSLNSANLPNANSPSNGSIEKTSRRNSTDLLPAKNLTITLPPLNPTLPPINTFMKAAQLNQRDGFKYFNHSKRLRLASVSGPTKQSRLRNHTIPDSLLLKVFEYLTLPELMKLQVVSKKWRQLLYFASNLFTTLDLKPWNTSVDDKALIAITDFVGSRPRIIDISNCFHIKDEGFSYMINEIGISGQIEVLRAGSIWEVSAMAIMDISVPTVGKYLEEIDLSNCRNVRDNVLERILGWDEENIEESDILANNSQLEKNLGFGCKNLKRIKLGYCKHLTDSMMFHLARNTNHSLEILDLTRCTTITDKGFQYWSACKFPNMRQLVLKDCTFLSDLTIGCIAQSCPNLVLLNLNFCCALTDSAIDALCQGTPYLRQLDLSFCGSAVSDSSLVQISLHMKNLERLVIKGCIRVTRAGVDLILLGCTGLYYLDISQCKNAHIYPGRIPAPKLEVNQLTKSAFVTAGPYQNVIEIVL